MRKGCRRSAVTSFLNRVRGLLGETDKWAQGVYAQLGFREVAEWEVWVRSD